MFATKVTKWGYKNVLKPYFFSQDAEDVHDRMTVSGEWLGRFPPSRSLVKAMFAFEDPRLEQVIHGMHFVNPIGLSAGFDYDAKLINILPSLGFGFHTVGTITAEPYEGNTRPRLGRLPKSKSLLVNKGFKSAGMDADVQRILASTPAIPLGISIGSTNRPYKTFDDQVQDVVIGFSKALSAGVGDYFELNISCPNLANIKSADRNFSEPEGFRQLLRALAPLPFDKPVFVKMHLEKTEEETGALIDVAAEFSFIKGFIFSNLCKNRSNPQLVREEVERAGKGNFSGKPVFEGSNTLIRYAYKRYGDRFVIIGCGGVFTAEDAYEKIRSGASLVQMITGMIYEGPQVIGEINRGLVNLLARDGLASIKDAIGSNHR